MSSGLPVRPRVARFFVLLAVFVCAACGLVYELALVALGSYLIGNSIVQASIVLAVMVFAMGIGSLAAKPLQRRAAGAFAVVEGLLSVIGGLSVLGLYASFAWLRVYTPALVVVSFVIGLLIGAEIPLLMTLLQRIRKQAAGSAVADMFAADYVGALVGGLAFPFLLLPIFGQIKGALLCGVINALAGIIVVLWLFGARVRRFVRVGLTAGLAFGLVILVGAYVLADKFEVTARQALFRDPIVYAERTPYQDVVLTSSVGLLEKEDLRLFLNGDLQFSSIDEYRYHESLVHPAMAGRHRSVLILGGGDGLALREVLRYQDVRDVTLVELDPAVIRLAREYKPLVALNRGSFEDPRVTTVTGDAFNYLRDLKGHRFDTVIIDMPDPDEVATAKLYSVEFYGLVRRSLAPGGRLVAQSGSPFFVPRSFWCVDETMRAAGLKTTPFQIDIPSFGNWGFILAGESTLRPRLDAGVPRLRFLDAQVLRAATVFPVDRRRLDVAPNTLIRPRILDYQHQEWRYS